MLHVSLREYTERQNVICSFLNSFIKDRHGFFKWWKLQIEQFAWKFDHLRTIIGQKVEPAKHRLKNLRQGFSLNIAFICHFDEK